MWTIPILTNNLACFSRPLAYLTPPERLLVRFFHAGLGHLFQVENARILDSVTQPVIFAFNHNNYLETLLIGLFLLSRPETHRPTFVVDWMYGQLPVLGWLLNQVDPIYVYHKQARFAALNRRKPISPAQVLPACLHRLHHRRSIAIFPEGRRNHHPNLLCRGRRGIGALALSARVPILPIGVDFPARRRRSRIPAFGPVLLRLGEPLTFPRALAAYTALERAPSLRLRHRCQGYVAARITHAVMLELARLSGKQYPFPPPAPPPEAQDYLNGII